MYNTVLQLSAKRNWLSRLLRTQVAKSTNELTDRICPPPANALSTQISTSTSKWYDVDWLLSTSLWFPLTQTNYPIGKNIRLKKTESCKNKRHRLYLVRCTFLIVLSFPSFEKSERWVPSASCVLSITLPLPLLEKRILPFSFSGSVRFGSSMDSPDGTTEPTCTKMHCDTCFSDSRTSFVPASALLPNKPSGKDFYQYQKDNRRSEVNKQQG